RSSSWSASRAAKRTARRSASANWAWVGSRLRTSASRSADALAAVPDASTTAPSARWRSMAEPRRPSLSRARQDYLKALYALGPEGESVSTSALAERLQVSPPSVTIMLRRLAREGWVYYAPRGGARLSLEGRRAALAMVRRHRILETF